MKILTFSTLFPNSEKPGHGIFVETRLRHLVASGGSQQFQHFEQFDALLAALDKQLGGNSDATVLVKGSRFMKMERVVNHLIGSTNTGKDAH